MYLSVQKGFPGLTHKEGVLSHLSLGALADVTVVLSMRQSINLKCYQNILILIVALVSFVYMMPNSIYSNEKDGFMAYKQQHKLLYFILSIILKFHGIALPHLNWEHHWSN